MRGGGVQGCLGGGPGGSRRGPGKVQRFWAKNKKNQKNTIMAGLRSNIQGAGGSSRPNGSGYPLSVPAVAHPPHFYYTY